VGEESGKRREGEGEGVGGDEGEGGGKGALVVGEMGICRASWEEVVGSGSNMAFLEEVVVESGSSMASSWVVGVVNGSSMVWVEEVRVAGENGSSMA